MPTFTTLLCTILTGMKEAIGMFMYKRSQIPQPVWLGTRVFIPRLPIPDYPPVPDTILDLACQRIGRTMQRLVQLYERWKSNTLPKLRPSRAGKPRPDNKDPNKPKPLRLPNKPLWLAGGTDYRVRGKASQLEHLLNQSDATEFLTAVPRAGRLLRPLCRMLGMKVPAIALPPRPRKPRKPRPPKPPRPPARHGKYTPAQIRRYSPGKIPKTPRIQP